MSSDEEVGEVTHTVPEKDTTVLATDRQEVFIRAYNARLVDEGEVMLVRDADALDLYHQLGEYLRERDLL